LTDLFLLTTILDKFGIKYETDQEVDDDDEDTEYTRLRTTGDHTGSSYCFAEFRFKEDGSFHDWGVFD
jgi:hypothetical protein